MFHLKVQITADYSNEVARLVVKYQASISYIWATTENREAPYALQPFYTWSNIVHNGRYSIFTISTQL